MEVRTIRVMRPAHLPQLIFSSQCNSILGNPAGFHPNLRLIIIPTTYSPTSSIQSLTTRDGGEDKRLTVSQSLHPDVRGVRWRNSVMLMNPRGTRVSHVRFPQTCYSFCFRCRRLCPTILVYPWQREQDEMRPGFTRDDRRWFGPRYDTEILVENTYRDTAPPW